MTEEEKLAEEYFDSMKGDWNEELERTGKRHYFVGFDIKQAFLAGIEAGKLQWHDLRKNPNDLPYVSGFYLVSKSCWDGCYTHVHYFNKGGNESGHWDVNVDTLNFIAWCELPKFEVVKL